MFLSAFLRAVRCLLRYVVRLAVPSMRHVRLAAYALVVFGALAAVASRSVYADVTEIGLGIGHELAKLEDLTSGAYVIRINGAELHRASTHAAQSVTEVLDRYEAYCRSSPSELGQAMRDIPHALEDRSVFPMATPTRAGIVREEASGRGMVACFVDDDGAGDLDSLRKKLDAVARSGDISELGRFRYAFAETSARGATRVITLWTDGPLCLGTMFPATGDAPGTDSSIVPRPARSRRTLSASIDGYPASVRIYESAAPPAEILAAHASALRAAGFREVPAADPSGDTRTARAAYVRSDGTEVIVSMTRSGERTSVTVLEAPGSISVLHAEKLRVSREP